MNLIFKMWGRGTLKPSDIFCTRITVILCWPSDFILFHPPWALSYNMYAQIPCLNYHTFFFFPKEKAVEYNSGLHNFRQGMYAFIDSL